VRRRDYAKSFQGVERFPRLRALLLGTAIRDAGLVALATGLGVLLLKTAREISMNKSLGYVVACVLGLGACNVEHYDDDCADSFDIGDDFDNGPRHAGAAGSGGHDAGAHAGGGNTGATPNAGGTNPGPSDGGSANDPPVTPEPTACQQERDCAPGYNCNPDVHECQPADEETCAELATEAACTHRSDCTPVYGGTNCSCGQDCECHGGEPGCVCETFQFFVCQAAE
jgi:hypothetical protein